MRECADRQRLAGRRTELLRGRAWLAATPGCRFGFTLLWPAFGCLSVDRFMPALVTALAPVFMPYTMRRLPSAGGFKVAGRLVRWQGKIDGGVGRCWLVTGWSFPAVSPSVPFHGANASVAVIGRDGEDGEIRCCGVSGLALPLVASTFGGGSSACLCTCKTDDSAPPVGRGNMPEEGVSYHGAQDACAMRSRFSCATAAAICSARRALGIPCERRQTDVWDSIFARRMRS